METYRLRIFYNKTGPAIFISSRNLLKIIERTLRRIDIPMKFTEGFNPHPKISLGHSLPLNIAGENESFDVFLYKKIDPVEILEKSKNILPEGIIFHSARWLDKNTPSVNSQETFAKYTFEKEEGVNIEPLLKNYGKILSSDEKRTSLLIKINNFSHKKLTGLLLNGSVKSIKRELLQEN